MRPIMSAIGPQSYKLAKELARILTPLAGNTMHAVKNSTSFVDRIHVIGIELQDQMISFDVTNLFTQVPVDEALRVVEERLSADDSLKERTSIPTPQLIELIELCLRSTYFQFQDRFFEQTDGAAMGSPLSPVIANLYMEHLEENALQTAPLPLVSGYATWTIHSSSGRMDRMSCNVFMNTSMDSTQTSNSPSNTRKKTS